MTKWEKQEEKVTFVAWGKSNAKEGSLIKEQGEPLEGLVTDIKESRLYKKIYALKVKGIEGVVLVTGKTDLNEKMGYGKSPDIKPVKVSDEVRITWTEMYDGSEGRKGFRFDVDVKRAE